MLRAFILTSLFLFTFLIPVTNVAAQSPQVIKLERFRKALWKVHVSVKGKEGDFLFDTGGGITLLAEEFAKGVDCKFWGRFTGYNMFGKKGGGPYCSDVQLQSRGVALTPVNVGRMSFEGMFPGDKAPDGLLSLDSFDGKVITIDQKAATLTIETDKSLKKRVRTMKEFPLRISRECSGRCLSAFLGVKTPDGMTWLNLDTGAGGVSLISKEYAASFGLGPEERGQELNFTLDSSIKISSPVMVTDMIMDGNLGQPFLANYVITLDLKQGRAWLGN
ncbi:MAG TPA: hypothetical protein PLK77_00200 [Pyrinomonadaceae bacterium]|nr:hypothetical protein [Pyrinomonadaceae bacterium]